MERRWMGSWMVLLAMGVVPPALEAQSRVGAAVIAPAPPAKPAARGAGARGPRRGGWFLWPWGGWTQREDKPLPKPVEPEPPARAWVENKDYQAPRLNPAVTDYGEGALPAPRAEAAAEVERVAPCLLVLAGGERVEAVWCEWRADSVRYEDDLGRVTRLSLDLVNLRASTRPGRR